MTAENKTQRDLWLERAKADYKDACDHARFVTHGEPLERPSLPAPLQEHLDIMTDLIQEWGMRASTLFFLPPGTLLAYHNPDMPRHDCEKEGCEGGMSCPICGSEEHGSNWCRCDRPDWIEFKLVRVKEIAVHQEKQARYRLLDAQMTPYYCTAPAAPPPPGLSPSFQGNEHGETDGEAAAGSMPVLDDDELVQRGEIG